MRPRWLLLAVSVLCLLLLFPAGALSQGGTEIACGSAVVDGTVGAAEWADGTKLPMTGGYFQTPEEAEGWLYLKNDEQYLYVGMTMDVAEEHELWWDTYMAVSFTDEPCGSPAAWVDDKWVAAECTDSPEEGTFWFSEEQQGPAHDTDGPSFTPASEDSQYCSPSLTAPGVVAKASQHTVHQEMRIDLTSSQLNCVGPGDCLRLWAYQEEWFCPPDDPDCQDTIGICVMWPDEEGYVDYPGAYPGDFGTICLNPCEVEEEFVPEPGSILLLGSGLAGLAGYATLRWRTRE
jgi:hypothetical protein